MGSFDIADLAASKRAVTSVRRLPGTRWRSEALILLFSKAPEEASIVVAAPGHFVSEVSHFVCASVIALQFILDSVRGDELHVHQCVFAGLQMSVVCGVLGESREQSFVTAKR